MWQEASGGHSRCQGCQGGKGRLYVVPQSVRMSSHVRSCLAPSWVCGGEVGEDDDEGEDELHPKVVHASLLGRTWLGWVITLRIVQTR